MPLDKTALSTAIKAGLDAAFTAAADPENNSETIRQNYVNAIADAMDDYVKSIKITLAPGTIQVQGTATAQNNVAPLVIDGAVS